MFVETGSPHEASCMSPAKINLASLSFCSGCEGISIIPVNIGHGNGQAIYESVPPVAAWPPDEDGFAQGIPEGQSMRRGGLVWSAWIWKAFRLAMMVVGRRWE